MTESEQEATPEEKPPEARAFEQLVAALEQAFVNANEIANQQLIENFQAYYFDAENKPLYLELKLPLLDGNEFRESVVQVPKLCLASPKSLSVDEVSVNFKVMFTGMSEEEERKERGGSIKFSFPAHQDNHMNYAEVGVKFKSSPPPEGIIRLQDRLNALLP